MLKAGQCLVLGIFLWGCAATIEDVSRAQYISRGFTSGDLREGGLGLLPVYGVGEGFRRPLGDALDSALFHSHFTPNFVRCETSLRALGENGFAETYETVVERYRRTSILDTQLLQRISEKLGVRYLFHSTLVIVDRNSRVVAYSYNIPITNTDVRVTTFGQIWDAETGQVVWEGFGDAASSSGPLDREQGYSAHARAAAGGLVHQLYRTLTRPQQPK